MNTIPNNTGEPAVVPSVESVEEAQVQTANFSAEFGRGDGAVVNLRTRSGTNSVPAHLFREFPAPAPLPDTGANRYVNQSNLTIAGVNFPSRATITVNLRDYIRFDQYLGRIDHSFNDGRNKLTGLWIGEHQRDEGGTSSSASTLGRAGRSKSSSKPAPTTS
jgi:hypothetical protein